MNQATEEDEMSASHNQSPLQLPLNLPCFDLLVGRRDDYNEICVLSYKATIIGSWKAAKIILEVKLAFYQYSYTARWGKLMGFPICCTLKSITT
ncbi:unnamed protein product [Lactuca virosa]|uniref:Uncharacterized protein n=1 Tax=Lactuca virosa TaxID=75947 RepID=A0AAU9MG28_9ASTR|nr:unnamed protein product [Lactuca virosa]